MKKPEQKTEGSEILAFLVAENKLLFLSLADVSTVFST